MPHLVLRMLEQEGNGLVYLGEQRKEGLTVHGKSGRAQLVLQLFIVLRRSRYRYTFWWDTRSISDMKYLVLRRSPFESNTNPDKKFHFELDSDTPVQCCTSLVFIILIPYVTGITISAGSSSRDFYSHQLGLLRLRLLQVNCSPILLNRIRIHEPSMRVGIRQKKWCFPCGCDSTTQSR